MKTIQLTSLLIFLACSAFSQVSGVVASGIIKDKANNQPLPFVNILVQKSADNSFVTGTVSDEKGFFAVSGLKQGDYFFIFSYIGYDEEKSSFHVGRLATFLDLGVIYLEENTHELEAVSITGSRMEVSSLLDKKTFIIDENLSQQGGSVLQSLQNLPGITVDRDGKVFLRGSDKVTILIDGKQTALTGMGTQSGLDNIPASAIESIEIINNPSAKHDASGMAGIVNIVFRKNQDHGFNGRTGLTLGVGGLAVKRDNVQGIRSQYRYTPKINPSLSINYKKNKYNIFLQGDLLYHKQMMKNEFTQRYYTEGEIINQQFLENRTQPIYNIKGGIDWSINPSNMLTFSSLFNYREYTDLGDIPYDDGKGDRLRLWQYYENEINQTLFATITHKFSFTQPGHSLTSSFNYSFRRKDEVFYFTNHLYNPSLVGTDTTMLIADENIFDLTIDYTKPMKFGRMELGTKQRARIFPNDIVFKPGINSILDLSLSGSAEYREWLSAVYGTIIYETKSLELEAGIRFEYADIDYLVDPSHSVYSSTGFYYFNPFPNVRASWIMSENSRLSVFYNRRVDRPEEKDLRTFPTYASPEILSMGNPTLEPQFTNSFEIGYRHSWDGGFVYGATYHRITSNLLTKIITEVTGSNRLAQINQNADKGSNTGVELVITQSFGKNLKLNASSNVYRNVIGEFSIINAYPTKVSYSQPMKSTYTGNAKINLSLKLPRKFDIQLTGLYHAPDIIPQGRILARYSVDAGLKKDVMKGKGEFFLNASDIFNTLVVRYELEGNGFRVVSDDFYETQVVRIGYQHRF